MSLYTIRPLSHDEIPRLIEINPDFVAHSVLQVEKLGSGPFSGWSLRETPLSKPFRKGSGYDFDAHEQDNIRNRLDQGNSLIVTVEDTRTGHLAGLLDVEEESWRRSAWIWNLMLDTSAQRLGLGRQLVERTIAWSRQRKLRAILLETQSNNTPACHFYAHMGFRLIGINEIFYTNHDLERNEIALFWAYTL